MAFFLTAAPGIADSATGQTEAAGATLTVDPNGVNGIATISCSDAAGAAICAVGTEEVGGERGV